MSNKKSEKEEHYLKRVQEFYSSKDGLLSKLSQQKRNELVGEITFILMASEFHRRYLINDIAKCFMPALHLNQFKIYKNKDGNPVALVTWAYLSEEIEKKHMSGKYSLEINDWKSGDRLWGIDFMAPFGHMKMIKKDLEQGFFGKAHGRSLRMDIDGKIKGIYDWYGKEYREARKEKAAKNKTSAKKKPINNRKKK